MTETARAQQDQGVVLTAKDYRFHFFAWWSNPAYVMSTDGVDFTEADLLYFAKVESIIHRTLSPEQRAWYVKTRDSAFGGAPTLVWQESTSTAPAAFQASTQGGY